MIPVVTQTFVWVTKETLKPAVAVGAKKVLAVIGSAAAAGTIEWARSAAKSHATKQFNSNKQPNLTKQLNLKEEFKKDAYKMAIGTLGIVVAECARSAIKNHTTKQSDSKKEYETEYAKTKAREDAKRDSINGAP